MKFNENVILIIILALIIVCVALFTVAVVHECATPPANEAVIIIYVDNNTSEMPQPMPSFLPNEDTLIWL